MELLEYKFKPVVGLVLLECCKTSMYVDFTGPELVLTSIIKTLAILNIPNIEFIETKATSPKANERGASSPKATEAVPLQTVTSDSKPSYITNLYQWDHALGELITTSVTSQTDPKIICRRLSMALSQLRLYQQVPA